MDIAPILPVPAEERKKIEDLETTTAEPKQTIKIVEETTAPNHQTLDIRFGRIKPFAGKRETLEKFLEDITLHHLLNKIKEDEDKVAFALSYCEGGDTDSWKTAFIKKSIVDGRINFGT